MEESHGSGFVERRDNGKVLEAIGDLKTEMTDRLARIETKQEALGPRCNSHSEDIATHDGILRGVNGRPGMQENVRTLQKDNAKQSAVVATGITLLSVSVLEYVKFKLLGWK